MKKTILLLALITSMLSNAQHEKGFSYGVSAALQINSAILPNISLNRNVTSLLNGDSVVKGEPQLADFTLNYKAGFYGKYEDGFGFSTLSVDYTTTKIQKELRFNTFGLGISLFQLDKKYAYLDTSLAYNIYLYKGLYYNVGGTLATLVSYSGDIQPNKTDMRIFTGFGYKTTQGITIDIKGVLGVSEVYDNSYIHHIMIPITVSIPLK